MPPRSKPGRVQLLIALLLAAMVVFAGGLSAYRKIQSFQPVGFSAAPSSGHWLVTAVEDPETALAAGDQILLVNGQGAAQIGSLASALSGRATSEVIALRGAEMVTLTYELPPLEIDWTYLILALIGIGYLLIGFYTLLRDPRRPSMLFFLWCITSTVLYLVTAQAPFDLIGKASYLIDEVARIFLPPLTLHLFAIFPRPVVRPARLNRAIPFFYLPAAFLLALQADLLLSGGNYLFRGSGAAALAVLDRLELLHLVLFALVAAGVLLWRLRRTREHEAQRQSTWVAVGMAAGYAPFLALYALPYTIGMTMPLAITSVAVLPLALVPLTFAYAILRYKLWDIGSIVRDSVTLSLTVLIGVIGFALANLTVARAVPEDMVVGRNLITFVSGLLIAGLMIPTRKGISGSLERLQYRSRFGRRRALAEFGRELLKERNLERLAQALSDQLDLALDLKQTNLYLTHGQSLFPARSEPGLPEPLPFRAFESDFWETEVDTLSGVEMPADGLTITQQLYAAGYRYAFPLRVRSSVIGLVVTGYRDEELPLSSADIDLVRNLLNQAALAIENAQLLHQVQQQLDEVSRLQRFSQGIFESSPAGIAVIEEDDRVRSANLAFGDIAGVDTRRAAGKLITDLLPIHPLPTPQEGIREISFTDAQGRERYLQASVAPHLAKDAALRVLVVQDVSERIEMENELKEKDRLASLGMLAAGVAHEVNTPITGISSYAQMLIADTPDDDPRRQVLEKVEKQTFRAAQIVNNLLEFARNQKPEQHGVALDRVIHEVLYLLGDRISQSGVELEWTPPTEEIVVRGNETELSQVFTNLAVNALQAMDAKGGTLAVNIETDSDWVWVSVEDSGPGISPKELDKIFQPFFSSKLGAGGTGLGLAITYNIVRRHGGDIRVISHPGEGCRFVVELPRGGKPPTTG